MFCTAPRKIKSARINHKCLWCGDIINSGESYKYYRCYDCGDASTVKMHPECFEAADEESSIWGQLEFYPFSNARGKLSIND